MKILCNGFNLYEQLGIANHVLEKFTKVFGGYSAQDLDINHSFSVLKVDEIYKIVYKNKEMCLNNCGKIVKICSNDERVVLLNDEGKLYKIDLACIDTPHDISHILNPNEQIVNISCGSKLTVAYSETGSLYNIPHQLNFKNENIINIRCGREHCLLLDKFGNVYTFGRGRYD